MATDSNILDIEMLKKFCHKLFNQRHDWKDVYYLTVETFNYCKSNNYDIHSFIFRYGTNLISKNQLSNKYLKIMKEFEKPINYKNDLAFETFIYKVNKCFINY